MTIPKTTQKSIIAKLLILTIAFTFALSVNYIFAAWTGPTQPPPLGNTPTPVHVGFTTQTKDGALIVGGLRVLTNLYVNGQIEIGRDDTFPPLAGTIRWSGTDFEGYDGSTWVSLTSGDTIVITGGQVDCDNAGGSWEGGQGLCYFDGASCPSGWSKQNSYSSTYSNSCSGIGCSGTSCPTGQHSRRNLGKESCPYKSGGVLGQAGCTGGQFLTCLATLYEVGCIKN